MQEAARANQSPANAESKFAALRSSRGAIDFFGADGWTAGRRYHRAIPGRWNRLCSRKPVRVRKDKIALHYNAFDLLRNSS